jgi:hypothetical protein
MMLLRGAIFSDINGFRVSFSSNEIEANLSLAEVDACAEAPNHATQR